MHASGTQEAGIGAATVVLVHFRDKQARKQFADEVLRQPHAYSAPAVFFPGKPYDPDPELKPSDEEQELLYDEAAVRGWDDLWRGMPRYEHADLMPQSTLRVHLPTREDRRAFFALVGQRASETTKFIWHPENQIDVAADKVWHGPKVTPRHPIYVLSKGRWDSRLTQRALEFIGVDYRIVIEPQEWDQYARVIPPEKLLRLPFSNLGFGGIPARNWIWQHAIDRGAERHWILDDNISGFCRFVDNMKIECDSAATFCAIEDWVDRYENVAMAGFNYDYFAPRKQGTKIRPITLNTRIYSGILLKNDCTVGMDVPLASYGFPERWRGRYNEDTDLSLRLLKAGWCTALFNAFLMYKKPTLKMKGGNATELYQGVNATWEDWKRHAAACDAGCVCDEDFERWAWCPDGAKLLEQDGRWRMAVHLKEQHPYETTVERKWGRWQHQVDYRAFQPEKGINVLRPRPGFVPPDEPNEYGMVLQAMPPDTDAVGRLLRAHARERNEAEADDAVTANRVRPSLDAFLSAMPEPEEPAPAPAIQAKAEAQAPLPQQLLQAPPEPGPRPSAGALWLLDELGKAGHVVTRLGDELTVTRVAELSDDARDAIELLRDELLLVAPEEVMPSVDVPILPPDIHREPRLSGRDRNDVSGVTHPLTNTSSMTAVTFDQVTNASVIEPPRIEVKSKSLAEFLSMEEARDVAGWVPDSPPDLGIWSDTIVLNFATDGLEWDKGAKPVGITVATDTADVVRFLPFRFAGGNLDEEVVKRWARTELKGKRILGAKVKFDCHMAREWGVDLEELGCTFTDVQHTAALLDDHRKRFAVDELAKDYFPREQSVTRIDEGQHHRYHAADASARELYTAALTARLRQRMQHQLDAEELNEVQALEDAVIPAVVEMERNGVTLDLELLEQYHRECHAEHDRLMIEIAQEVGFAFEHTEKGWQRLIEKLGLPMPTQFDEARLRPLFDNPIVRKGYLASQTASLASKTFDPYKLNVDANGTLRFEINQLRSDEGGTVSGRFSIGYVQQVPNHDNHSAVFGERWYPRRLVVPPPGCVALLEGDAAQIEYRLAAHHANNKEILAAYAADPRMSYHKQMWAMMKRYKPDMLYVQQKSFNFARQYGAKSIKLAVMMGMITEREGNEIRQAKAWNDPRLDTIHEIEAAYKRVMPEGDDLLDMAAHLAKPKCDEWCRVNDKWHRQYQHRGFVKTLVGRRSRFPNANRTYIAFNRVIQGSGADIMKRKLAEVHAARKETGLVLQLTVHDSIVGGTRDAETLPKVDALLNAQSYPQLKVPILWEVGQGANWAECKG